MRASEVDKVGAAHWDAEDGRGELEGLCDLRTYSALAAVPVGGPCCTSPLFRGGAPAARETREKSVNELVDVTPTHTGLARPARTRKRPQRAARASHEWGSLSRCFIGPYSCGPGLVDVRENKPAE